MSSDEFSVYVSTSQRHNIENRPQLRLHHLFVLTAVLAALLAIQGPQRETANSRHPLGTLPHTPAAWGLWGVLCQLFVAMAITALASGIAGYRRGLPFFNQPGHWILVEIAVTALLGIPASLLYRSVDIPQVGFGSWAMTFMVLVSMFWLLSLVLGRIVLNIFLARKCRERRWKRVFFAKAVAALILFWGEFLVIALTLASIRADHSEQVRRDASHLCGVIVQLAISCIVIGSVTYFALVQ